MIDYGKLQNEVEGEVLAVPESAAAEQDRQVAIVVVAAVHVRSHQDHGAVKQIRFVFFGFFQSTNKVAK